MWPAYPMGKGPGMTEQDKGESDRAPALTFLCFLTVVSCGHPVMLPPPPRLPFCSGLCLNSSHVEDSKNKGNVLVLLGMSLCSCDLSP